MGEFLHVQHPASILPHPDVAHLRCRRAESGYRHVYRTRQGCERWCAKVRVNGRLRRMLGSASPLPHQAALHAIRWYQARYGERWREYCGHGKRMRRLKPFAIWKSESRGGFLARVWEFGKPIEVTGRRLPGKGLRRKTGAGTSPEGGPVPVPPPDFDSPWTVCFRRQHWKTSGRLLVFKTAGEAELAVRGWIKARWGEGERVREAVWRI